jgi:DNA-binding YbaB/EbfC family protein
LKNIGDILKQAKEMQARMAEAQERLGTVEAIGVAGGGLVEVTLTGKGDMRRIRIDPTLAAPGERAILEDLVVAAHNDARTKVEMLVQEEMSKVTGGLPLPPGLGLPG